MHDTTLPFLLAVVASLVLAIVFATARSCYFGFTLFLVFVLWRTSLSAFAIGEICRLDDSWISGEHIFVFTYMSAGLLATAGGIVLAGLPRLRTSEGTANEGRRPRWLNPTVALLALGFGALA